TRGFRLSPRCPNEFARKLGGQLVVVPKVTVSSSEEPDSSRCTTASLTVNPLRSANPASSQHRICDTTPAPPAVTNIIGDRWRSYDRMKRLQAAMTRLP